MKENYDVIVVGAGPAGIMTCYELYLKNPELEVLLIDKGHDVLMVSLILQVSLVVG